MYENEEWVPIEDFPNYMISDHGRVKHVARDEVRKLTTNSRGFVVIAISRAPDPTKYLRQVNKLVAEAFLPPPKYHDDTSVWHIDGDLQNCHVRNLMWERRDRVLEWNAMHRDKGPRYKTPPVKNNRTGMIYRNAYECAMDEKVLESYVVSRIERQASHIYDDKARYRYYPEAEFD